MPRTKPSYAANRLNAGLVVLNIVLIMLGLSACSSRPAGAAVNPNPPASEPAVPDTSPPMTGSVPTLEPEKKVLEFDLCAAALAKAPDERMYQGYDGWLFFLHELGKPLILLEQGDFAAELGRALATRGVALVVMPIPIRTLVRPKFVYPEDPTQARFSLPDAEARYESFLEVVRDAGFAVVNVVGAARKYELQGGLTFYRRDVHWTPEGAAALAREVAKVVRQVVKTPLPYTQFEFKRIEDRMYIGSFLGNWLFSACGYALPPEPVGRYQATRPQGVVGPSDVVLAGSSYSTNAFTYNALSVALQSEVSDFSIGAGGAQLALESYFSSDEYVADPPQVLVWEFPTFASGLGETVQRELIGGAYGGCDGSAVFESTTGLGGALSVTPGPTTQKHYLSLTFSDLSLLNFSLSLRYQSGKVETLEFTRYERLAERNTGRYFTTLLGDQGLLAELQLTAPGGSGSAKVQLCSVPG